jgi:hypothetical protein
VYHLRRTNSGSFAIIQWAPIKNFCEQIFEMLPAPSGETLNAAAGSRLPRLALRGDATE